MQTYSNILVSAIQSHLFSNLFLFVSCFRIIQIDMLIYPQSFSI